MKKLLPLVLLLLIVIQTIFSQTATSIANGAWLSPFTWNCMCVPTPGYTVIINHHVTLNTSFQISSGSITVNASGSLVQDADRDMMISGGAFVNHGTTDFRYLLLQTGSFTNTDTLRLKSFANFDRFINSGVLHKVDSFYNVGYLYSSGTVSAKKFQNSDTLINDGLFIEVDSFHNTSFLLNNDSIVTPTFFTIGNLVNNGSITGVDSFTNAGVLYNHLSAIIQADSMLNMGTLTNNGTINTTAFANTGTINNTGMLAFNDAFNLGVIHNSAPFTGQQSLFNMGKFSNNIGGMLLLGKSFLNADSIQHDAWFFNNGVVHVNANWYNADTVAGDFGSFVVADSSGNSGFMLGSFDFCDLTPPTSIPFIDANYGTISPQITWCSPQAPQADFTATDVCLGNPTQFVNTSSGPVSTCLWDFGDGHTSSQVSPLHYYSASGTYIVKLLIGNGSVFDSTTKTLTVYQLPSKPQIALSGDTVSCNSVAASYQWYLNGMLQSSITLQSFVATQSGFYSVKITDANGCQSVMSDSVLVTIMVSAAILNQPFSVSLFPNPFKDEIRVVYKAAYNERVVISFYTTQGALLLKQEIDNGSNATIVFPNASAGMLFYELQTSNGSVRGKLIKVN